MQTTQSFCSSLHSKKLVEVSEDQPASDFDRNIKPGKINLLWIQGKINHQPLRILLDCGATISCIAKRCVTASSQLKNLARLPYNGDTLIDVNGNPLNAEFVINCSIELGNPPLLSNVEFVVIEGLPYSCILGLNFLKSVNSWEVNNDTCFLIYRKTLHQLI